MSFYQNKIAPINKQTIKKLLEFSINGENVTTLWLPAAGRTGIGFNLQNGVFIPKELLKKLSNFLFFMIDGSLDVTTIENHLDILLEKYSQEDGVMKKIHDIVSQNKSVVFIIDNFTFRNHETLKYVISLRQISLNNIKYVFLGTESEFYSDTIMAKEFSLVFHNIIKVPYLDKEYAFEWIDQCAELLETKVNEEDKNRLYKFCGGITGLLKNAIRAIKKYGDVDKALVSDETMYFAQNLWQRFSKEEQNALKSIAIAHKPLKSSREYLYLKEHNLINQQDQLNGDWVYTVIGNKGSVELKARNGTIIYQGIDLDEVISQREMSILLLLCSHKGFYAERDAAAKVIWGDNYASKYSDWAMDQIFSRLRRKLVKIGMPDDIIKTLKGKGFKLQNIRVIN